MLLLLKGNILCHVSYNNSIRLTKTYTIIQSIIICNQLYDNKCSVLRRQSGDTNRNIKRSVYCQLAVHRLFYILIIYLRVPGRGTKRTKGRSGAIFHGY